DPQDRVLPERAPRRGQQGAHHRRPSPPLRSPRALHRPRCRDADPPRRRASAQGAPLRPRHGGGPRVSSAVAPTSAVDNGSIAALCARYLVPVYKRADVAFVRGRGAEVWDADGRRVLDFFSTVSCVTLGHAPPAVTEAIKRQAETLVHVSNLHHSLPQARLAELLCRHSFGTRVFLCNSGAEANEAAIKATPRFGPARRGRYEVLTTLGSFHGRTLGTIAATGQEKVRRRFEPLLPGLP